MKQKIRKKIMSNTLINNDTINLKSRKLWISVLLFVTSLVMLYFKVGDITPDAWIEFTKWVFTIYVLSNTMSKLTNDTISNWKSKKFWGFLVLYIISIVLLERSTIAFIQWSNLIKWSYATYAGANVGAKLANNYILKT